MDWYRRVGLCLPMRRHLVVLLLMIVKPPFGSTFKNPCWQWHLKFQILKGRFCRSGSSKLHLLNPVCAASRSAESEAARTVVG